MTKNDVSCNSGWIFQERDKITRYHYSLFQCTVTYRIINSLFMTMSLILFVVCAAFSLPIVIIPLVTILLAIIATFRWRRRISKCDDKHNIMTRLETALYTGRVSHARFHPTIHSFSYPLFFTCLNLKESSLLFGGNKSGKKALLWPLTYVVNFLEEDHLKNGEGLVDATTKEDNSLHTRICRLVKERTNGICEVHTSQKIWLLTHLQYFGYCFNPVSFYYIMQKEDESNVQAIVAEVSNTPWLEMYCYVLHPNSIDIQKCQPGRTKNTHKNWFQQHVNNNPSLLPPTTTTTEEEETKHDNDNHDDLSNGKSWESTNYIFEKKFHVSPFMDMEHLYDWTFWHPTMNKIAVSTTMIKNCKGDETNGKKYFNAYFEIAKKQNSLLTPMSLCRQILEMPYYCLIIQLWIHVEAFWLFLKGVHFIPHPDGTETAASQIIGTIMTPFFAMKDWWDAFKQPTQNKEKDL